MLLEMAASAFSDRVAVASGTERLSYGELLAAAGAASRRIRETGALHAALLDVNSLAVPVALFASAWAGVPFVPLNYRLTAAELRALLERIAPCCLVTDAERARSLDAGAGSQVLAREDFLGALASRGDVASDWSMDPEDVAILLFTSGTTGAPKAAVLRSRHLVSYILGSVEFGSAGEDDAALVAVPPYHVAGMAAILSSVYAGRRIVQQGSFDARDWIELARRERVTNAFVVPTMLARIVDALEREGEARLPSLRSVAYGGGKMPLPVIERAMRLLPHVDFTNAYGLTETSSTIALLGPDDHRAALASGDEAVRRRLVSVGRPLPSVELEIRDGDGKPLAAGQAGEIWVRGEQVSGEYLGRGSQLDEGGWFCTRDGGSLDDEGYLFVTGRVDDVIVRGGENLSPGEIEEVLLQHPALEDCAVVGVPDEQWGEVVAAVVVAKPGSELDAPALQGFVKERLRSSRVPVRIEFRDELPYNETGKLLRRRVRAELVGPA
jgi:acyl-CoA synthetase (AMP-forming)/AMP-acid ligase II